jgi:hypothetical protein
MPRKKKLDRYTVEPGREIYCDDKPYLVIVRPPSGGAKPAYADAMTQMIVRLLNRNETEVAKYLDGYLKYRSDV